MLLTTIPIPTKESHRHNWSDSSFIESNIPPSNQPNSIEWHIANAIELIRGRWFLLRYQGLPHPNSIDLKMKATEATAEANVANAQAATDATDVANNPIITDPSNDIAKQ